MSTELHVRLPIVDVSASDLAAAGGLPLDAETNSPDLASAVQLRPGAVFGLRASSLEGLVMLGSDLLALCLAMAVMRPAATLHAAAWAALVLVSFAVAGLYRRRLRLSALDDVPAILIGSFVGLAALGFSPNGPQLPRAVVWVAAAAIFAVLGRTGAYRALHGWRARGVLARDTVLVGTSSRMTEFASRIHNHPETGLRVRGVLGEPTSDLGVLPLSGDVTDLPDLIDSGVVDTLIVGDATSEDELRVIQALRSCCADTEILVLPRLSELSTTSDDEVWGIPLHRLRQRRTRRRMAVKRAVDVMIAAGALLAVSWLIALAALAVRLELGPGVIYRQERVGRNGRHFHLLKLRSMRPPPPGSSAEWAASADRTGHVGAFIRRFSIDELPQLVNVLRGDMSLVGPRPERPEYVDQFGREFPSYGYRHRMMVGLTGLAAVEGLRGDTSIAERAYFDNWYIEHWSLWFDVKIMLRTTTALLKGTGQ